MMNCRTADDFFWIVSPSSWTSGGELGQGGLHPVIDGVGVDVGIAAEHKADGEVVAAVIAARRTHVDHLVDADDLRLDRLRERRFDDGGGGAGKGGRDYGLRRHDVRELRDRDPQQRQGAGNRDDDRDNDGEPRPIDKDRRDHWVAFGALGPSPAAELPAPPLVPCSAAGSATGEIAGGGVAGLGDTVWPGRTRCSPSLMTSSPSLSPLLTTAVDGVDWPRWMRRCSALFCASTT